MFQSTDVGKRMGLTLLFRFLEWVVLLANRNNVSNQIKTVVKPISSISYGFPFEQQDLQLTDKLVDIADNSDKKVIKVICDDLEDFGPVSFLALVDFIPKIGEDIILEDKKICKVTQTIYATKTLKIDNYLSVPIMAPTVYAVLQVKDDENTPTF